MEVIASRKNPLVLEMRRIARGETDTRILLDGVHLVDEARAAGIPLSAAAFSADALAAGDGEARRLASVLAGVGVRVVKVSDAVMKAMSPVSTPSGVIAVAQRPKHGLAGMLRAAAGPPLVGVAIDVQDPGNLGAIARALEAAGATGLVAGGSSTDPFGWKALRGSMGSALRLPVVQEKETMAIVDELRRGHVALVVAVPSAATRYDRYDWTQPSAIVVGSEGAGVPSALLDHAQARVKIPMQAPVDSLNVAVSVALLAYEARRQRLLASKGR